METHASSVTRRWLLVSWLASSLAACGTSPPGGEDAGDAAPAGDATTVGDATPPTDAGDLDGAQGDATVPPGDASDGAASADGDSDGALDAGTDAACVAVGTFGSTHGEAFSYGRHYPNGAAAVDYIYGPKGMWGSLEGLAYNFNYYASCATSDHAYDRNSLIAAANGPPFVARDANCHLLWTASTTSTDPQIAVPPGNAGFAFREHSGTGAGGAQLGKPFSVYWYDDNSLAIAMSQAYARPTASGLLPYADFTRWSVVAGDAASWHGQPYGAPGNPTSDCCIDTMALNGLYDLASGDFASAAKEWTSLTSASGATYDQTTQRYLYPSVNSNYYFGLYKVLTDQMMGDPAATPSSSPTASTLLQHSMALDSHILDNQEHDGDAGAPIGWVTDIPAGTSLINTETVAAQVLGLGARANAVFEPGVAPLTNDPNGYFVRPYHVLSAVSSAGSQPGYMTNGPGFYAPQGTYTVDFRLRAPAPTGTVATVSVQDVVSGTVLASHDVAASEMASGNQWTQISLVAAVPAGCNQLALRTHWSGSGNLDVGPIRVR
jgi:hypothetical protein